MSYTALYRKFRPDSFAEVKGQDAIVRTLKNQCFQLSAIALVERLSGKLQ